MTTLFKMYKDRNDPNIRMLTRQINETQMKYWLFVNNQNVPSEETTLLIGQLELWIIANWDFIKDVQREDLPLA